MAEMELHGSGMLNSNRNTKDFSQPTYNSDMTLSHDFYGEIVRGGCF
jgi:hypothetical protein